jgi:gamma-glutamylcyclotransferase (GGCT)/AIG2-like uncharacterized protein YtfP
VLVFVYGTLMRGAANHDVLVRAGARFVGVARTAALRTLVDLGPYPALLPADAARDRTAVHGELYEVGSAALGELDAFEGCPSLYRRERVEVVGVGVQVGDVGADAVEQRSDADTYVLAADAPASAPVLEDGRYDPTAARPGSHRPA